MGNKDYTTGLPKSMKGVISAYLLTLQQQIKHKVGILTRTSTFNDFIGVFEQVKHPRLVFHACGYCGVEAREDSF